MRSLLSVVVAAVLGAVIGSTFAEAGQPTVEGPAVCNKVEWKVEPEKFINASLAAGREHFVSVETMLCAW